MRTNQLSVNWSANTDPQQQKAASPQFVVGRSLQR